jgi:uncharacterized protein YdeI (YjbR/CyaY-like superfamily)
MEISEKIYLTDREQWRKWLKENHATAKDIWLIYYKKNSGKPRIPYNDAVEEALCFGWIDSIVKTVDEYCYVQRFSPRRKNSQLSEANKERIRQLVKSGRMTSAGLDSIKNHINENAGLSNHAAIFDKFEIPNDILKALKKDKKVWENFSRFPEHYKRVRIGWIDAARTRQEIFITRLNYFIRMTAKNKMYGMIK